MIQPAAGLAYLRSFPDFESGSVTASDAFGLERIVSLLEELGSPHLHLPIFHLAGTKGKGSTSVALASILTAAGYRTGVFTQPHLVHVHERFMLDGVQITDPEIDQIMLGVIQPAVARLEHRGITGVQQFEAQVALALIWFRMREAQAVVLETGLGGRLDGTNVAPHPIVTVLTPIGFDHMQILGNTLTAIAAEKAAIIKPHSPVISAPQEIEALSVLEQVSSDAGSPLLLSGRDWRVQDVQVLTTGTEFSFVADVKPFRDAGMTNATTTADPALFTLKDLWTPLPGAHQATNAGAAIAAALVARSQFPAIDEAAIRRGLAAIAWPGRLQILPGTPEVVLDGAHTRESASVLAAALVELFPSRRLLLIVGLQRDKDIAAFAVPLSPLAAVVIATQVDHPRAAAPAVVAAAFTAAGSHLVETIADPLSALQYARKLALPGDVIVATGSLYLVGALLAADQHNDG